VPVSVTALSQADPEKLQINSFTDYANKRPNMTFSYGTANYGYVDSQTIAIRGVSDDGATNIYIDDTPVTDSLDPRVVDIARIEVLKGPQGTLFGQAFSGGNLRLITVAPKPDVDDRRLRIEHDFVVTDAEVVRFAKFSVIAGGRPTYG